MVLSARGERSFFSEAQAPHAERCLLSVDLAATQERLTACNQALEHPDLHPMAKAALHVQRAWVHGRRQDWQSAFYDYRAAERLAPGWPVLHNERGLARLVMSLYDQAILDYDRALRIDPKLSASLFGRGVAKLRKGDTSGQKDLRLARAYDGQVDHVFAVIGITPD